MRLAALARSLVKEIDSTIGLSLFVDAAAAIILIGQINDIARITDREHPVLIVIGIRCYSAIGVSYRGQASACVIGVIDAPA